MKKAIIVCALFASTVAFAMGGVLDSEHTNGTVKYCKYSNDVIITIASYKMCPMSI